MNGMLWLLAMFFSAASISSGGERVIETTVCEILASPVVFDGKLVEVRGRIYNTFEVFEIQGEGCGQSDNSITLAYPEKGTIRPVPSFDLERDDEFKKFENLLTQRVKKEKNDGSYFYCDHYEITATLTGRLDGVEKAGIIEDQTGKVVAVQGFGHANRYRARLVIQSISEVVARDISAACQLH